MFALLFLVCYFLVGSEVIKVAQRDRVAHIQEKTLRKFSSAAPMSPWSNESS